MKLMDKMKKARDLRKDDIAETIKRIREKTKEVDPGSEEFRRLRVDMEQELKNKKLLKDIRFCGLSADKVLMVAVILVIAGFGFALDLESPKALKIASFVVKLPMCKL